jgi:peptidoglycan/LPS O-acetylase OafA/YrhL
MDLTNTALTNRMQPNLPSIKIHQDYLDGWRGMAILALLLGHFFPVPGLNFGTVGVNLFFVLSGLLMGGLLFESQEPIRRFYRRRIARILPAHTAYILIMVAFYWAMGWTISPREILGALFFVINYTGATGGPGTAQMPFGHIWSLAVEEHCYIVLSMVALGARRRLFSDSIGLATLVTVSVGFVLFYQWLNPRNLLFSYWLHTEVAGFGLVTMAWWIALKRPPLQLPTLCMRAAAAPTLLATGLAFHWWSMPPSVQTLLGTGSFVLALAALCTHKGWFATLLSWPPLCQLGRWSYSLYLWQQPFYLWTRSGENRSPVLALGLALACGLMSYYLIERPARTFLNARWGANPIPKV